MDEHARILVIDDDEGIRRILSTILEDEGHIVETAENGKRSHRQVQYGILQPCTG